MSYLDQTQTEKLRDSLNRLVAAGHRPTARTIETVVDLGLIWDGERFVIMESQPAAPQGENRG